MRGGLSVGQTVACQVSQMECPAKTSVPLTDHSICVPLQSTLPTHAGRRGTGSRCQYPQQQKALPSMAA